MRSAILLSTAMFAVLIPTSVVIAEPVTHAKDATPYEIIWSERIPMRDGAELAAVIYNQKATATPGPCIVALTPYSTQQLHNWAKRFAGNGLTFVAVDSRGRGDSGGAFRPFIQEANDGADIVEWTARRPWCNGKVGMWGGSYLGYTQWAAASKRPAHLSTIVPVASVGPGIDFPMRANIPSIYTARWLAYVNGRALQQTMFSDQDYWKGVYRRHTEGGRAYLDLASLAGSNAAIFTEWANNPHQGAYWDAYLPSVQEYGRMDFPILTITGSYDDDQPGALNFYMNHMKYGPAAGRESHYLVIGPWDHAGTRVPAITFKGLTFGPRSMVDLVQLHLQWYRWAMAGGPKPDFLKDRVAYYVAGADEWRYSPTFDQITGHKQQLFLAPTDRAFDRPAAGILTTKIPGKSSSEYFVYDPRVVGDIAESDADVDELIVPRGTPTKVGTQLTYNGSLLDRDTDISGNFQFTAWIGIDQPDVDLIASIYEVTERGDAILLSSDFQRARYRSSLRKSEPVNTRKPLRYDFRGFNFTSRRLSKGSRLRLIIAPVDSISAQKNFGAASAVAEQTLADARSVIVRIHHGKSYQSYLTVPFDRQQVQ